MKKYIALLLALVMVLLAACCATQPPFDGSAPSTEVTESSGTGSLPDTPTDGVTDATGDTTEPSTAEPTTEPTTAPITEPTDPTGDSSGTGGTEKTTQPASPTEGIQPPEDYTLKVAAPTMTLEVGKTGTISYEYTGTGTLTWKSSDTSKATVSNGKVTAVSAGNAVITVTDGVKTVQCRVTVTNPTAPVIVNLTVSPTSLNLVVGNTSTLTASYNGTGTLSWSSSNTAVVTVSNGKVTAKAAGSAVVTVSDGNKSATCSITVTAPATAKTFNFNTQNNTTITAGNTFQIDYSYSGSNSELTWSSTDSSVLTVNNSGVVTAKAKGAATVKVTNGEKTWRLSINVEDARPAATSFVYSNQNAPLYDGVTKYAGDYMTFKVNVQPDASNPNITVTSNNTSAVSVSWKLNSSDINEVTLNFNGAGTATVVITSADGAYSQSYTITVKSDYGCNPGGGQLTPEQFVNAYNGVVRAIGMDTSYTPSGYLVLTLSDSELTWARARREAEGASHHWYSVGKTYLVLTYEGINADGKHIFYVHR